MLYPLHIPIWREWAGPIRGVGTSAGCATTGQASSRWPVLHVRAPLFRLPSLLCLPCVWEVTGRQVPTSLAMARYLQKSDL